jgi:hypothetical protein
MRKEVSLLLDELREACRRPLFQEIALFNKTYSEQQRRKRLRSAQKSPHPLAPISTALDLQQQQDAFETASQASSTATSAMFAARLGQNKRNISGSSMTPPKTRNFHTTTRTRRWDEVCFLIYLFYHSSSSSSSLC